MGIPNQCGLDLYMMDDEASYSADENGRCAVVGSSSESYVEAAEDLDRQP